jgi:hypothetical protein
MSFRLTMFRVLYRNGANHWRDIENMETTIGIIAMVAALALLGGMMVLVANNLAIQEVEAGCERAGNENFFHAYSNSKGRCLDRGTL